jgi:hypothetical protein
MLEMLIPLPKVPFPGAHLWLVAKFRILPFRYILFYPCCCCCPASELRPWVQSSSPKFRLPNDKAQAFGQKREDAAKLTIKQQNTKVKKNYTKKKSQITREPKQQKEIKS